jgi:ferredoxin-like protein FixX
MSVVGAFETEPGEIGDARTVILIGNAGSAMWRRMNPTPSDPTDHAIDTWTRGLLEPLAKDCGATAMFPFEGPPYAPFVSWTFKTGRCFKSPLGMAIHDRYGLWFALRAAFLFTDELELPAVQPASPCDSCADKPCLSACPVEAFSEANYDHVACRSHVGKRPNACSDAGCLARRACPIGQEFIYEPEHAAYHMKSFTG